MSLSDYITNFMVNNPYLNQQQAQISQAQISQAQISQAQISQAQISQAQISQAQISQTQTQTYSLFGYQSMFQFNSLIKTKWPNGTCEIVFNYFPKKFVNYDVLNDITKNHVKKEF